MNFNNELIPPLACDGYKIDHRRQFLPEMVDSCSNATPRKSRVEGINSVIVFGPQYYVLSALIEFWNEKFFNANIDDICDEFFEEMCEYTLSVEMATRIGTDHWRELHKLGYLPIEIRALEEGVRCPIGVPFFTVRPTNPKFIWLAQFIETDMSAETWGMTTSATNSNIFRKIFEHWCKMTGGDINFVQFQGHDFSYRGMFGRAAAAMSAAGHLLSFNGTDTLPGVKFLKRWYGAKTSRDGIIGCSVFATEHAVMMSSTGFYILKENSTWEYYGKAEFEVFKRLITEVYPDGFVSIVSDTWNLWTVLTDYCVRLKEIILNRNGKVIFRPDSGNPVDILCGIDSKYELRDGKVFTWKSDYKDYGSGQHKDMSGFTEESKKSLSEHKGVIELLWDVFGGTVNELGYRTLDPHVGAIYGDSITAERAWQICERLANKKFVSTSWVAGIGSFTYQYVTRDTYGIAIKQTYAEFELDGKRVGIDLFKDPITDDGTKKSAKGITVVLKDSKTNKLYLKDKSTWAEYESDANMLKPIFRDGVAMNMLNLSQVRQNVANG